MNDSQLNSRKGSEAVCQIENYLLLLNHDIIKTFSQIYHIMRASIHLQRIAALLLWSAGIMAFTQQVQRPKLVLVRTHSSSLSKSFRSNVHTQPLLSFNEPSRYATLLLGNSSKARAFLFTLHQSSRSETVSVGTGTTQSPSTVSRSGLSKTALKHRTRLIRSAFRSRQILRRWGKHTILLSEDIQEVLERCTGLACSMAKNFWWSLPLLLCVVPLYTLIVLQTLPTTPVFWKLVRIEQWLTSVVAAFLASNASYYLAAAYLHLLYAQQHKTGFWILAAGTISTIFHTVQAAGYYHTAEALCYLDHGVAGTAILYFFHVCGNPSRRAWGLGVSGLVALACPGYMYPFWHSLWHVLSAATAVVWVHDSEKSTYHTKNETDR